MFASILFALVAQISLPAQTAATSSGQKAEEEVVLLSPFVTTSESDKGYRSASTLIGSRTAKSLMEIPASVSIINRQQIEDLNAVQASEVLQFGTAGVTQNQTINDDVNIRGFRTSFSLRNGVTKTGHKRNPMYDVERLEVIKGPAAMLLGNNSFLGGAVNFISMKPTHTRSGDLQLTVGANNYARLAANIMGPLYKTDGMVADYRLTIGGLTGDREKTIEEDDQRFIGGGLALYFGDNTSVLVNAYHFVDNGYFYWEDFLDYNSTRGTTENPMTAVLNQFSTESYSAGRSQDAFWENEDSFVDVTFLNKLTDNANLRLYYFGGKIWDRRRHVRGITIQSDNRTLVRQDLPLAIDNYTNNIQGDLAHKFSKAAFTLDTTVGFDWSSGYNRQDISVNNPGNLDTATLTYAGDDAYFALPRPGAGLPMTTQASGKGRNFSYYFQENLSFLNDRLILVGGLRWFETGGTSQNHVTRVVTASTDRKFRTHKYGIVIRPIPSISLYYTDAANTFPQGGFTDRFQANDQLGPRLETQEGTLSEYGIKIDRNITDSISAYGSLVRYEMSLTNVRTFGVLPEGVPPGSIGIIQSAGDMAEGWELEYGFRAEITSGTLDLVGTYTDGESRTATDPNVSAADFVPTKLSLMGKYSWTSGPVSGLTLGATYFDQSKKRNANFWVDFPPTYNLFARYAWRKHWSVQLNLNNVTDERYIVAIAANGLAQTQPGFDSKLAIRYRW